MCPRELSEIVYFRRFCGSANRHSHLFTGYHLSRRPAYMLGAVGASGELTPTTRRVVTHSFCRTCVSDIRCTLRTARDVVRYHCGAWGWRWVSKNLSCSLAPACVGAKGGRAEADRASVALGSESRYRGSATSAQFARYTFLSSATSAHK